MIASCVALASGMDGSDAKKGLGALGAGAVLGRGTRRGRGPAERPLIERLADGGYYFPLYPHAIQLVEKQGVRGAQAGNGVRKGNVSGRGRLFPITQPQAI